MSAILFATSSFTPGASPRQILEVAIIAKIFGKVKAAQAVVVDHARSIAPKETGELVESISAREPVDTYQEIIGEVVAEAGHASFVEFGTGLKGAGTYPYPLPKEGVPITGAWVYDYKKQNWVGMPARPFMRPALDVSRAEVLAEFKA